jgi:hypothetical protein
MKKTAPSEPELPAPFLEWTGFNPMPFDLHQPWRKIIEEEYPHGGPEHLATCLLINACKRYGKWCGVHVGEIMNSLLELNRQGHQVGTPAELMCGLNLLIEQEKVLLITIEDLGQYIIPFPSLLGTIGEVAADSNQPLH